MSNSPNSIWETIVQNGWYEEIAVLYQKEFPVEVRAFMADWLAKNMEYTHTSSWVESNYHEPTIIGCIDAFMTELKRRIDNHSVDGLANLHYVGRMKEIHRGLLDSKTHVQMLGIIRDSLERERIKVQQLTMSQQLSESSSGSNHVAIESQQSCAQMQEINDKLASIQSKCISLQDVPNLCDWLRNLKRRKEVHQRQQIATVDGIAWQKLWEELQNEEKWLTTKLKHTICSLRDIMDQLVNVHAYVLNQLNDWRNEQRLVALGKPSDDTKLENIDKWFEKLANCIETLEMHLPNLIRLMKTENYPDEYNRFAQACIQQIQNMRGDMMNASLVISKEPKQIVRPSVNFSPVHLVVLAFSTNMMIEHVDVVFINQQTAESFFRDETNTHQQLPTKSGRLKCGKNGAKICKNRVEYQTMTVSKVSKSTKRGKVMEQRFWLYFRATVRWNGHMSYLYTTSLPLSVASHTLYEGKAWTYVLWFNAFPKISGRFWLPPDHIEWELLIEAINLTFVKLGKSLTSEQKCYLKNTLFRGEVSALDMVSKWLFCVKPFAIGYLEQENSKEEKKQKRYSYTFGEWLYCTIRILSFVPKYGKSEEYKHAMRHFWKEGKILGYVAKPNLEALLEHALPGTFIIRFPENAPDRVALYFYCNNPKNGNLLCMLYSINTHFNKDKPLQDWIVESSMAIYLYPNIPKGQAFTKMKKSDASIVNGYFNAGFREDIPNKVLNLAGVATAQQTATSSSSTANFQPNNWFSTSSAGFLEVSRGNASTTGSYTPPSNTSNADGTNETYDLFWDVASME